MSERPTNSGTWRPGSGGVVIRVRLTPRAAKDAVDGVGETAEGLVITARVRALPEKGSANTALERVIADWLEVPKSTVAVAAGTKSRIKTVVINGDAARIGRMIDDRISNWLGKEERQGDGRSDY